MGEQGACLEKAGRELGWGASQWERLWGGSMADSAAAFGQLASRCGGRVAGRCAEHGWPWRFGALAPQWRVFATALDEARLGELLSGNLAGDDSGVAPEYGAEREALRMMCALRVFKESSLGMGDPDPRINSLRRIKLGQWREFPQVGAPGLRADFAQREAADAVGPLAREALACFASRGLARPSARALRWSLVLAGIVAGLAGVFAARRWAMPALAAASAGAAGAALSNKWVLGWARRLAARLACARALRALGCPPSSAFEAVAAAGMACSARASGDGEAIGFAASAERGDGDWGALDPALRKRINASRAARAKSSMEEAAALSAQDERALLAGELGPAAAEGSAAKRGRSRL